MFGEQGLELVIHFLKNTLVLDNSESELSYLLLLLAFLNQAGETTTHVHHRVQHWLLLLLELCLQLLQLLYVQAIHDMLCTIGLIKRVLIIDQPYPN